MRSRLLLAARWSAILTCTCALVGVARADVQGSSYAAIARDAVVRAAQPTATLGVPIEAAPSVHLSIASPRPLTALTVTSPGGATYDLAAARALGGDSDPRYELDAAGDVGGTWTVTATTTLDPGCEGRIAVVAEPGSDITVGALVGGPPPRPGRPILIAAFGVDGNTPLGAPTVRAVLRPVADPVHPLPIALTDDGTGGDGVAGDGTFGAQVTVADAGVYLLDVVMTGTDHTGFRAERRTVAPITVETASATLLASALADAPRDPDGDGRIDTIALTGAADITIAGDYAWIATVRSASGAALSATGQAALAAGANQPLPEVTVDGRALYALGDGPYAMSAVLFRDSEPSPADALDGLHTLAVTRAALARDPIVVPAARAVAVSGAMRIEVDVDVDTGAAGDAHLRGRVLSAGGRTAAVLDEPLTLTAGVATLSVDLAAARLLDSGAAGPYHLADLTLRPTTGADVAIADVGPPLVLDRAALTGFTACGDALALDATVGAPATYDAGARGPARYPVPATLGVTGGAPSPGARLILRGPDGTTTCRYVADGAAYAWAGCDPLAGPGDVVLADHAELVLDTASTAATAHAELPAECDACARCAAGATCSGTAGQTVCLCAPGAIGDGFRCETATACDALDCGEAFCIDDGAGARCQCPDGGELVGGACRPPACDPAAPDCATDAACVPVDGRNECVCNAGTVGDGRTCVPDPCVTNHGGCDPSATCTADASGDARCTCPDGTLGDGVSCPTGACATAGCGAGCTETADGPVCITDECAAGATCGAGTVCHDALVGYTCDPGDTGLVCGLPASCDSPDPSFIAHVVDIADPVVYTCAADFDGDGWVDFIGAPADDNHYFLRLYHNATAGEPEPDWTDPGAVRTPRFTRSTDLRAPGPVSGSRTVLACGDISGDGKADVVTARCQGSDPTCRVVATVAYLGNGDGTFQAGYDWWTSNRNQLGDIGWSGAGAAIADVDGDGDNDLVWGGATQGNPNKKVRFGGQVIVARSDGGTRPTFSRGDVWLDRAGMGLRGADAVAYADVTGDGRADLILGSPSSAEIRVYADLPATTYQVVGASQVGGGPTWTGGTAVLLVADFDLDGRLDLLAGTDDFNIAPGHGGNSYYWHNDGTAAPFAAGWAAQITARSNALRDLDTGFVFDYDHDPAHTPDLLLADGNHAGSYYVIANRGPCMPGGLFRRPALGDPAVAPEPGALATGSVASTPTVFAAPVAAEEAP